MSVQEVLTILANPWDSKHEKAVKDFLEAGDFDQTHTNIAILIILEEIPVLNTFSLQILSQNHELQTTEVLSGMKKEVYKAFWRDMVQYVKTYPSLRRVLPNTSPLMTYPGSSFLVPHIMEFGDNELISLYLSTQPIEKIQKMALRYLNGEAKLPDGQEQLLYSMMLRTSKDVLPVFLQSKYTNELSQILKSSFTPPFTMKEIAEISFLFLDGSMPLKSTFFDSFVEYLTTKNLGQLPANTDDNLIIFKELLASQPKYIDEVIPMIKDRIRYYHFPKDILDIFFQYLSEEAIGYAILNALKEPNLFDYISFICHKCERNPKLRNLCTTAVSVAFLLEEPSPDKLYKYLTLMSNGISNASDIGLKILGLEPNLILEYTSKLQSSHVLLEALSYMANFIINRKDNLQCLLAVPPVYTLNAVCLITASKLGENKSDARYLELLNYVCDRTNFKFMEITEDLPPAVMDFISKKNLSGDDVKGFLTQGSLTKLQIFTIDDAEKAICNVAHISKVIAPTKTQITSPPLPRRKRDNTLPKTGNKNPTGTKPANPAPKNKENTQSLPKAITGFIVNTFWNIVSPEVPQETPNIAAEEEEEEEEAPKNRPVMKPKRSSHKIKISETTVEDENDDALLMTQLFHGPIKGNKL